jgi:hypothetical protein
MCVTKNLNEFRRIYHIQSGRNAGRKLVLRKLSIVAHRCTSLNNTRVRSAMAHTEECLELVFELSKYGYETYCRARPCKKVRTIFLNMSLLSTDTDTGHDNWSSSFPQRFSQGKQDPSWVSAHPLWSQRGTGQHHARASYAFVPEWR